MGGEEGKKRRGEGGEGRKRRRGRGGRPPQLRNPGYATVIP